MAYCDDGNPDISPAADEICDDAVGNDCDGDTDDADEDGYEDAACGGGASSGQDATGALFLMGLAFLWMLRRKD